MNPSWVSAAGDMISTTEDLHTFISALTGRQAPPGPAAGRDVHPVPDEIPTGYGLGVFVQETDCGGTVITHNGGFFGWAALMYSTPDGGKTLTASLNSGDAADFATTAEAFQKAQQRFVKEVFCGGQAGSADQAAEPTRSTG